jgi:hypothetical protein
MRILLTTVIILFLAGSAFALPSDSARAEIDHLFVYLRVSGCMFNRNGTWYSSEEAVNHLRGKYEYLLKKDLITTTESFVERAASKSSMSGEPYLVRCGRTMITESGAWFLAELARFRTKPSVNGPVRSTQ